ncbi:hypothetical protein PF005_g24117 [Phytophthora fragariae]|uniref:Uncharacterized protein n=1 Tax=Phytophthora fragariae TaxID=53985 RepID=A0A6A3QWJ8_9STRA|nr:hypothetical protein PF003_g34764 [Phytophthora fragariae]KAE8924829.1 hypothetical protein PF009_g24944 [Phytophthora fragariae]KAE8971182.1 hypothetical protein PF011_g26125 [Phytophthora fragariae]KAE9078333.1 hypothetical protein PF010_g23167 [Phytophthora fragariae]KAE9082931.1 hypothetical protein PF007_g22110 [Phytophthora fragariae]
MSYAVLSFVKCSEKAHIVKTTRTRSAQLQRRVRHHRSSTDRYQHRPKTVHAFLEVSYSVPNFVKSNEKSHIGLTPRLDQRDYCSGFDTTGAAPVVASMGPTSRTCYVLSDVSYAVPNFVKSDMKSHIVAMTKTRPARLLERLRRQRGHNTYAD